MTHSSDDHDAPPVLLKTKLEDNNQDLDFSEPYRLSRIFVIAPEQKTFLPTRDHLARIGKTQSSNCLHCDGVPDSTAHILTCSHSSEVSNRLLQYITSILPTTTPSDIVLLNIPVTESLELPAVWLVATCMTYIWEQRVLGKKARLDQCRAEILAKLMLLRDTKWRHYMLHNSVVLLEDIINLHFY